MTDRELKERISGILSECWTDDMVYDPENGDHSVTEFDPHLATEKLAAFIRSLGPDGCFESPENREERNP